MTRYRDKETGEVVEVERHGMLRTMFRDRGGYYFTVDCEYFDARFEPVQPRPGSE